MMGKILGDAFLGKGQGAANGLLNNLIAYWPGDEASGNLLDAHTNGLDLTDNNTVTSNPGQVYATARQYTAANSEYHARPGDDDLLDIGLDDFTIATWVRFDGLAGYQALIEKGATSDGTKGYWLFKLNTTNYIQCNLGNGVTRLKAISTGTPTVGTWLSIVVVIDRDGLMQLYLDNSPDGNVGISGWAATDIGNALALQIGRIHTDFFYLNGRLGPTAIWNAALTEAQRNAWWNGGAGLQYSEFTS